MSQSSIRFSLPSEITEDTIRTLLLELQEKGLLYHIDDDPMEVITSISGERTFTDDEACALHEFWVNVDKSMNWDDVWALYPEVNL